MIHDNHSAISPTWNVYSTTDYLIYLGINKLSSSKFSKQAPMLGTTHISHVFICIFTFHNFITRGNLMNLFLILKLGIQYFN